MSINKHRRLHLLPLASYVSVTLQSQWTERDDVTGTLRTFRLKRTSTEDWPIFATLGAIPEPHTVRMACNFAKPVP